MKQCKDCKLEFELEDFPLANGKRLARCRPCKQTYDRRWWSENKERLNPNKNVMQLAKAERNRRFIYEYLHDKQCLRCGEDDSLVLEFDHIDRSTKSYNISDMTRTSYSIKRIEEEISKCQILCANCHRRKTALELDWNVLSYLGVGKSS
jgi:5-methylcytosine-specific restriction endonuclease McrA